MNKTKDHAKCFIKTNEKTAKTKFIIEEYQLLVIQSL